MSGLGVTTSAALAPHATAVVGIVGGGQLAQMTHRAATALGIEVIVLADRADCPAGLAGATVHLGRAEDLAALMALAERCDVVTLDHERTPLHHLAALADAGHAVRPGAAAAAMSHDKAIAREAFAARGLPVPPFKVVAAGDLAACRSFGAAVGWPIVVKAPTGGYDGRGVQVVEHPDDLPDAAIGGRRWLLEAFVPIAREVAVLVARRPSGAAVTYPVVGTTQLNGTCWELEMPASIPAEQADRARALAHRVADVVGAVGICAVELFCTDAGDLIVNEIATRPHNSGHATLDACSTSQFENHLRAVLDWPLGETTLLAPAAVTVNLFGPVQPVDLGRRLAQALDDPEISVHLYRKEPRPGRKIGHVTALDEDPDTARRRACRAARTLVGS